MISDVMFSSKTDMWSTPQDFYDKLNAEFGFTLDTCAIPENAKCEKYYTPQQDGLQQPWEGICWCNPPYGREISKWVKKAAEAAKMGGWLLCYSPPELTPDGFTNTYTVKLRSVLSKAG